MESLLVLAAAIVLALILGQVVRRLLGFVTEVESVSMTPTLAPGRRLLARRQPAGRPFHRGDILVVDSVEVDRPIIKRVVGLPGEHVEVAADGRVRVDGHDLVEPYVAHRGGRPRVFDVPAGHLLLLGDNRAGSHDARLWKEPYLPISAVRGRVMQSRSSADAGGPGPESRRRAGVPTG